MPGEIRPKAEIEEFEVKPEKGDQKERFEGTEYYDGRVNEEIKKLMERGGELEKILITKGAESSDIEEFRGGMRTIQTEAKQLKNEYEKETRNVEDPKRFLKFEKLTQPNEEIKELAERFRNSEEMQTIIEILSFLEKNIKHVDLERENLEEWKRAFRKRTAEEILQSKTSFGCGDTTTLFLSLIRAAGIPAKFIDGKRVPKTGAHSWARVFIEKKWIDIDPTQGVKGLKFDPEKSKHGPYVVISESLGQSDSVITSYENWREIEERWDYEKNKFKEEI